MGIFKTLLIITFLISIFKNTIYQLFLWQLKEYRIDRFLVHLKTWQGKRLLLSEIAVIKWVLLFFTPVTPSALLFLVVLGIFSFEAGLYIKEFLTYGRKFPVFTPKTVAILLLILTLCFISLATLPVNLLLKLLIIDRALLFLIAALIVLTNILVRFFQKLTINRAKQKIKDHSNLLVIGITGSYGKSSTKEFLAQILSQKFKVLKTPANFNTAIGIAKTILKSLKKEHQIFVCEMGAYKKGEIKAICGMVKPQIGIITGLNEQHLALFGSLKNTIDAKFELIEALPQKGLAVFNGQNKHCLVMAKKAKEMGRRTEVVKNEKIAFKTNLPGEIFLINFMLAKKTAEELKVKSFEIDQAARNFQLPAQTMQTIKKGDLVLIDDTYNSNPQGVLAALDFLKTFKGKRIFVFQPIIELGKASSRIHEEIGRKAAKVCDQIILTNRNSYQDFLKGAKEKVTLKRSVPEIKKGVILFEGKEATRMLKLLITDLPCRQAGC